jgi:hypothetical protein
MSSRQNSFTIRVRYSRGQQVIHFRGVGVYGRVNMSTLTQAIAPGPITGGATKALYWHGILTAVDAAVLAL